MVNIKQSCIASDYMSRSLRDTPTCQLAGNRDFYIQPVFNALLMWQRCRKFGTLYSCGKNTVKL